MVARMVDAPLREAPNREAPNREAPNREAPKELDGIKVEADVDMKRGVGLDLGGDMGTAGPGLIRVVLLPPNACSCSLWMARTSW